MYVLQFGRQSLCELSFQDWGERSELFDRWSFSGTVTR